MLMSNKSNLKENFTEWQNNGGEYNRSQNGSYKNQ